MYAVLYRKFLVNLCSHHWPYAVVIGHTGCTPSPLSLLCNWVDSHLLLPHADEKFSRSLQHEPGSPASALRLTGFRLKKELNSPRTSSSRKEITIFKPFNIWCQPTHQEFKFYPIIQPYFPQSLQPPPPQNPFYLIQLDCKLSLNYYYLNKRYSLNIVRNSYRRLYEFDCVWVRQRHLLVKITTYAERNRQRGASTFSKIIVFDNDYI